MDRNNESSPRDSALRNLLQERIRASGPLSFRDFMEEVLYHPEFGYYSSKPRIGYQGDFYTAPETDPIFATLIAGKLRQLAREIAGFTIIELGAGNGTMARHILSAEKFSYGIVERSAALRQIQQEQLRGLSVEWLDDLPQDLRGCIFSNEFFDALPVHRFVGRAGAVREIFVGENFQEIEAEPSVQVALPLAEGQVADINLELSPWIRRIASSLKQGFHLALDYGYLREAFFRQPRGTLMCYWRHQAHENPYVHLGEQDLTAHVNFSDLIDAGEAAGLQLVSFTSQKDFLIELGILGRMQDLAVDGSAESMLRLVRLKPLILPGGMGERFKVLLQAKLSS